MSLLVTVNRKSPVSGNVKNVTVDIMSCNLKKETCLFDYFLSVVPKEDGKFSVISVSRHKVGIDASHVTCENNVDLERAVALVENWFNVYTDYNNETPATDTTAFEVYREYLAVQTKTLQAFMRG